LTDARWFEKLSTITLLAGVILIGIAPLALSNLIRESLVLVVQQFIN
jgi:hypothetical protein